MLLSSAAPLPNNTLTPIPQSAVDCANAKIGYLSLLAKQARAITDCYTAASSYAAQSPMIASTVAATQAATSTDTPASSAGSAGGTNGTPAAVGSGNARHASPPPIVVSDNPVFSWTPPGTLAVSAGDPCNPGSRKNCRGTKPDQPQMLMPQHMAVLRPTAPELSGISGLNGIAPVWGTFGEHRHQGGFGLSKSGWGVLALGALVLYAVTKK